MDGWMKHGWMDEAWREEGRKDGWMALQKPNRQMNSSCTLVCPILMVQRGE